MEPALAKSHSYRPDIDGLRAVAVLLVLCFHLGAAPFSGGFVGVDVFYVISGFLITRIVFVEVIGARFSYAWFYERRIRRLLPALVTVLAFTTVGALWTMLPGDVLIFGKTLVATILLSSNVFFWRHSGYFDTSAEFNPLLHTWSLAVEEQFYLGLPAFLLLANRQFPGRARRVVAVACLLSFAICVWMQPLRPTATFYLAPFRAWQLLVGGLLALDAVGPLRRAWSEVAALLGLLLILFAGVAFDSNTPFPGWRALVPVIGTALVIHAGTSGGSWASRLLAWRPVVYVGLISYPLYLWHWPLIVFAKNWSAGEPLGMLAPLVAAASFALASLTYHFVESPLRGRRWFASRRQLFALAGVSQALLLVAASSYWWGRGFPGRYDELTLALDRERDPEIPFRECHDLPLERVQAGELCKVGDRDAREKALIWGDSHALAWLPALDAALRLSREQGVYAGFSTCPPLVGVGNLVNRGCRAFNESVESIAARDPSIRSVILVASWTGYTVDSSEFVIYDDSGVGNSRVFPGALERTARRLHQLGKRVVLLGPVPGAPSDAPHRMAMARMHGRPMPLPRTRSEVALKTANFMSAVGETSRRVPLVFVDVRPWFCGEERCEYEEGGLPLYRDGGHLSVRGAMKFAPRLGRILDGTSPN